MKDDTIYRQVAIAAVSDTLKNVFVEHEDIAKRIIGALPSAQSGWIPVTERLPEKDEQYYVTQLRYDVYDSKMIGAYVRETNHIWYSVRHKRWNVMANCKVVAWIEKLIWRGKYENRFSFFRFEN